jgi:hypothetical protein
MSTMRKRRPKRMVRSMKERRSTTSFEEKKKKSYGWGPFIIYPFIILLLPFDRV